MSLNNIRQLVTTYLTETRVHATLMADNDDVIIGDQKYRGKKELSSLAHCEA